MSPRGKRESTLCWDCANAVPSVETGRGCPWSIEGKPVEDWNAERRDLYGYVHKGRTEEAVESYLVKGCPLFVRDMRATGRSSSMKEYKITYHHPEGETETAHIIERTEKAAHRELYRRCGDVDITSTELVDANAAATKEQERGLLERIKSMVAELGPHSYLATAFDGVFEDAEQNIEFDTAFSMKARAESATAQLEEMASDCNIAKSEAARLREQLAAAREEIAALERRQLPSWLRDAARRLIADEATAAQAEMEQTADTMARLADTPEDITFQSAVKSYRGAKELRGVCEQIVAGLDVLAEE